MDIKGLNKLICKNLIRILNEKGIKQADLARHYGSKATYINMILKGKKEIGKRTIVKLSNILNIHPVELFIEMVHNLPVLKTSLAEEYTEENFKKSVMLRELMGSDIQCARIVEELIELLTKKNVISELDLSIYAREVLSRRKLTRERLQKVETKG